MFSPALGRSVRAAPAIPVPPVCSFSRPAAISAKQARPSHQRRLSSSKASIPPDSDGPSSAQQQAPKATTPRVSSRKPTGRHAAKKRAELAFNVPHVPPTTHLQKPEVKISSFFSLHRPISITTAIPPASTSDTFDSIFNGKKATMNNIKTLAGGINQIEALLRSSEQKQDEVVESEESSVQHLDGPPAQSSVDAFMASLLPFRPPPPPAPIDQAAEVSSRTLPEVAISTTPVKQRSWSTAVIVTESTDASGKTTYSARTEPMMEIQTPGVENGREIEEPATRQPFLERMRQRQDDYDRHMLLISVKRQRKLKMKKHKYKKLMKRTRLLRRKLDRT